SGSTAPLYAVDFSPGGELLAAGGWDGILRLWDTKSKKLRISLIAAPPGARSSGIRAPGSATKVGPPGASTARTAKNARGQTALSPVPRESKASFNSELGTRNSKPRPMPPAWLAITPEGYYAGSPGILQRLKFDFGGAKAPDPAGIEAALHKPEAVAQALSP